MLCVKTHLPTKQNADSQEKKRVLSVSQKHHVLHHPSLRPQLHALGWLAGLLLSKLSSAAVVSPWMCYKGFLGVTPCLQSERLHSGDAVQNALASANALAFKIWAPILAAAMLSCTHLHFISSYVLSLLYMFETPKSFQLRPWPQICTPILTAATLYCMHLHFISPMSCLCFEGLRNPNSSGRGGRRNTPTAVK